MSARRAGALIVALVPLAVYALTLQNGLTPGELQGGDLITHHYAQATARFANAPGYPLYTMLGWLWFQASTVLSPLLNPVARLSAYSTLYAVPSLVLLYALLLDVQRARGRGAVAIAAAATLCFAFTYFFWYYAVSAENYSSGVLNTLVILALALRWQTQRETRTLLWLAFACGLSLAHLLTVALAVPAVIVFVLAQQPDLLRRPRLIAQTVGAAALPLLSYAYVYWRGVAHPEWRGKGEWSSAWAWFADFLTTKQGQGELTWSWDGIPWQMFSLIAGELTPLVLAGGLLGLCLLPRPRAGLLLGVVALYVPFLYIDRYGNWFQAIIPLYPVFIIGIVALADRARATLREWARTDANGNRISQAATVAIIAVFGLLAGERFATNYARANLRDRPDAAGLAPGWALLADDPAPGARIAGAYEESLALDYLTRIWGARPDVGSIGALDVPKHVSATLYATRAAMPVVSRSLQPETRLSGQGLKLIALKRAAETRLPGDATPVGKPLARGVEFAGYALRRDGARWRVTLYWRAAQTPERDMAVSVRLVSGERALAQADAPHPLGGWYPFTRWQAGEVVRDDYTLAPEDGAAVEGIRIILYHADGGALVNDAVAQVGVK